MSQSTFPSTILITGGTLNIGYEAALRLAREHPQSQIVLASRSDKEDAVGKINATLKQSNTSFLSLDLSSLAAIRKFAKTFTSSYPQPITHLLLNAGLQYQQGTQYTTDGLERTFGVNHAGHALLLFLLAPRLATDARILITASGTHDPAQKWGLPAPDYRSAAILAHPDKTLQEKGGQTYYTTSKLTNVMYTYVLAKRFKELGKGWTVNAFDPGFCPATGLARELPAVVYWIVVHVLGNSLWLLKLLMRQTNIHSPQEAGANLAALVSEGTMSGKYCEGRLEVVPSSELSMREDLQEDLWRWTLENVTEGEAERQRFARFE